MQDDNSQKSVFWALLQLMYQGKHRMYEVAEEYKLTVMQASALMILSEDDPKPMRQLSSYFMCDASAVTGLIDRLESSGLVSRQNHPTDRRITLIGLTAKGAELKKELSIKTDMAEAERLNKVLNEEERKTLHDLVRRILDAPQ